MITQIDHLVLTVSDIEASVAFYSRALKLRAETFADNRRALHFGNQKINLQTLGMESLADDPRFKTQADRGKHNAELVEIFSAWAATQKKKAVYARAGELRGPIAYVHDMQDLLDSPQLTARGFLRTIDPADRTFDLYGSAV